MCHSRLPLEDIGNIVTRNKDYDHLKFCESTIDMIIEYRSQYSNAVAQWHYENIPAGIQFESMSVQNQN